MKRAMPYKTATMGIVPISGMFIIIWVLWIPTWVLESGLFLQAPFVWARPVCLWEQC